MIAQPSQFEQDREAGRAVAQEGGPDAAGLVFAIVRNNAEAAERMDARIREWVEQERDEWKARALAAGAQLDRIEQRILGLLR